MAAYSTEQDNNEYPIQEEDREVWHDVPDSVEDVREEVTLSIHALEGNKGSDTIKIVGRCKDRELFYLIDNGSTHSKLLHC